MKGIKLPCPCCGEANATILLNLSNPSMFTCEECNNEFSDDEVRAMFAKWERAFRWIATMPTQDLIDECQECKPSH